jgi:tetratricopeptide (TPR) repeat protein
MKIKKIVICLLLLGTVIALGYLSIFFFSHSRQSNSLIAMGDTKNVDNSTLLPVLTPEKLVEAQGAPPLVGEEQTERVEIKIARPKNEMSITKIVPQEQKKILSAIELVSQAQQALQESIKNGDSEMGIKNFSKSISPVYKFPIIYMKAMAYAYLSIGDCQESVKLYQEMVRSFPEDFSGLFGRALSYQICNQTQQALDSYQETLAVFPKGHGRYRFIMQQIKILSQ